MRTFAVVIVLTALALSSSSARAQCTTHVSALITMGVDASISASQAEKLRSEMTPQTLRLQPAVTPGYNEESGMHGTVASVESGENSEGVE